MLKGWQAGSATVVVALLTSALITLDLTDGVFRRWWSSRASTTDAVGGILVVLITVLIVNQVLAIRQQRDRSRATAAQAAIVASQAFRAKLFQPVTAADLQASRHSWPTLCSASWPGSNGPPQASTWPCTPVTLVRSECGDGPLRAFPGVLEGGRCLQVGVGGGVSLRKGEALRTCGADRGDEPSPQYRHHPRGDRLDHHHRLPGTL